MKIAISFYFHILCSTKPQTNKKIAKALQKLLGVCRTVSTHNSGVCNLQTITFRHRIPGSWTQKQLCGLLSPKEASVHHQASGCTSLQAQLASWEFGVKGGRDEVFLRPRANCTCSAYLQLWILSCLLVLQSRLRSSLASLLHLLRFAQPRTFRVLVFFSNKAQEKPQATLHCQSLM